MSYADREQNSSSVDDLLHSSSSLQRSIWFGLFHRLWSRLQTLWPTPRSPENASAIFCRVELLARILSLFQLNDSEGFYFTIFSDHTNQKLSDFQ